MKVAFIFIFLLSSCAWDSDTGWKIDPKKEAPKRDSKFYECVDKNEFGEFAIGGGCNIHGCWIEGGSCNEFGCAFQGECGHNGCEKPAASINCIKKNEEF